MNAQTLASRPLPTHGSEVWIFANKLNPATFEISRNPVKVTVLSTYKNERGERMLRLGLYSILDIPELDPMERELWVQNGYIERTDIGWFETLLELNERAMVLISQEQPIGEMVAAFIASRDL